MHMALFIIYSVNNVHYYNTIIYVHKYLKKDYEIRVYNELPTKHIISLSRIHSNETDFRSIRPNGLRPMECA